MKLVVIFHLIYSSGGCGGTFIAIAVVLLFFLEFLSLEAMANFAIVKIIFKLCCFEFKTMLIDLEVLINYHR